ncbi:MAG: nicotinate (nicotinamide) nucleotide adenylyltransferase [Acidobacteria bacterium]|nr:nicotinate (nicotinamide) nucleotide adenylyltransferase [Acidobacteriota bacterium]MBI3427775.1 nicotinate (nicotinamide) nucleotide adenylyltransferase [Acidobacteriota bacterium]
MLQRIGVYGGTFDPIHNGHLRVAAAILENFALDQLLFVPAFVPPHKRGQTISAAHHRYAMLALATALEACMLISTIELEAPARPYTIETLGHLQTQYPGAQLFFVMGLDSFRDITLWRAHERLLTEFSLIVATRPGYRAHEYATENIAAHLALELQACIVDLRGGLQPTSVQLAAPHTFITDYVAVDVSATAIRQAAQARQSLENLVPPSVADYIAKYQLYQLAV